MLLISETPFLISASWGATKEFPGGIPFEADGFWMNEALARGARPVTGDPSINGNPGREVIQVSTQRADISPRVLEVKAAIESLMDRADPHLLALNGMPRISVIANELGREVTKQEAAEAFALITTGPDG